MKSIQLPLKVRILQPLLLRFRPAFLATWLKRLFGIDRIIIETSIGSFLIDPISNLGSALLLEKYEPWMVETVRRFLKPGSIFVDVGANEGCFTILGGSLVGSSGRVVAVEPQERLKPILAANLKINGLDNVTLCYVAISDSQSHSELFISPDVNTGSSSLVRATRYSVPRQVVQTTTLTKVLADAGVGRVDLMKIDIEGFEYEAVFGSPELFREGRIRAIALEMHPQQMRDRGLEPADLVDFLRTQGYSEEAPFGNPIFVWQDR